MQKLALVQTLSQKLSPQQIQFIKLLQVPTAELETRVEEELEVNYKGDDIEIGFNVNYLLDALGAIESDEVVLAVVDGNSSCLLREPGKDDCKYVVMPMRL